MTLPHIPEPVSPSGIGEERGAVAFLLFLLPKPSVKPNSVRQTDPRTFPFPQRAPRLPGPLPPLVSPENMASIRAMPWHAFGARPGDRYKYKSKDDDGHEGRQDHPFADVADHVLPNPLGEPSLSRRSPPGAQSDVFLS